MGTRYVIAVMKVEDVEGSENRYDTRDVTLFEATHTDPARLARFASEEVLAVLAEAAGVEIDVPAVRLPPKPAWWRDGGAVWMNSGYMAQAPEMSAEERAAAEVPEPAAGDGTPKAKRRRRTNAQIEADKVAQAAGFRDASHQAEATVAAQGGEPEPALPAQVGESIEQPAAAADVFGQVPPGGAPGGAFAAAVGGSAPHADDSPPPAAPGPTGQAPIYDPFK